MSGRAGAGGSGKGQRGSRSAGAGEQQRRTSHTLPEWITLAISSLVVLTIVGFVVYEQWTSDHAPAAFDVRPMLEDVRFEGDRYYLPVVASNTGDRTAEDVRIRVTFSPPRRPGGGPDGEVGSGGGKSGGASGPGGAGGGASPQSGGSGEESSEFQIRYFTGGARFDAVAVFRQDPRKGELRVDIISYLEP